VTDLNEKILKHKKSGKHISIQVDTVYGKRFFLSNESDTLRSYRVYISLTMLASSALIQIESFK